MANMSQSSNITLSSFLRTVSVQAKRYSSMFWQLIRFGMVGISNVTIDLIALNMLLLRFPTRNPLLLLLYNSLAYTLGALNSFVLNKYWTFKQTRSMTAHEVVRFTLVNMAGIFCNDALVWFAATMFHPIMSNSLLWANASKLSAIAGTALITYFGMRLWVFEPQSVAGRVAPTTDATRPTTNGTAPLTQRSLSVILPAYNEEAIIGATLKHVITTLEKLLEDFEVVVINDGSHDHTQAVVESIMEQDTRVRLINHEGNQGYGAALVSGFAAANKELTFFMDSDGQFNIGDLAAFFPLIERYDAVLGYRIDRQDTWIRKLNAWAWKSLVTCLFGIHVRDLDCAFKLFHSSFFQKNMLETRGAMINVEMLYKLKRAGYRYEQLGVHHLPRTSGRATGAKLSVILRAFRELFTYARKWHREERQAEAYNIKIKEGV